MTWALDSTLWYQPLEQAVRRPYTFNIYQATALNDSAVAVLMMLAQQRYGTKWTPTRARSALRACIAHREQDRRALLADTLPQPIQLYSDAMAWMKPQHRASVQDIYMCLLRSFPGDRWCWTTAACAQRSPARAAGLLAECNLKKPAICEVNWNPYGGRSTSMVLCLGKMTLVKKMLFLDPLYGVVISPYRELIMPLRYSTTQNSFRRPPRLGQIEQVILSDPYK